MSQKRFCDLCDIEIAVTERWYDVMLSVKKDSHRDGVDAIDQQYGEFCYSCVRSGKAATELLCLYEERTNGDETKAEQAARASERSTTV